MIQTLKVVTGNRNKADEIAKITGIPTECVELKLHEIQSLDVSEVAYAKALAAYDYFNQPVVVDDTGMSIEALGGLPGALVSWFLDALDTDGILRIMAAEKHRTASVSTAIGYADQHGVKVFVGTVNGTIVDRKMGAGGFGYDPIFRPEGSTLTYAEMTSDQKNGVSMRRIALEKFKEYLERST